MPLPSKKSQEVAAREFVRKCQIDPLFWVYTVFGDSIKNAQKSRGVSIDTKTGLTRQQEDALRQWGELIHAKRNKMENKPLTPKQRDLVGKMGMSIQSANGNGKDFLAGIITMHFMDVMPKCKIMATANTGQQLRSVYWSEVAKIRNMAQKDENGFSHLQTEYVMQSDRMFRKMPKNEGDEGREWFTELVTINAKATPEEQGVSLSGRHADAMLIVVDEASGIPDAVFKPLDRTLTGAINLCFMIFNPTRNTGYAIESQTKLKEQWVTIHWTALDCENITPDQIERLRKYGEDSPAYRIGVLGLPPVASESCLIPYEWLMSAVNREITPTAYDPIIIGADIGGGGDRSVMCSRQGGLVDPLLTNNSKDTMVTCGWIVEQYHALEASVVVPDSNGLGAGVSDRLRELDIVVHPVEGQGKCDVQNEKYLNNRAHMFMTLREQFENKAISIPDDVELINELGALKLESSGNKIKIGSKKDLRRVLGFSPDKADALALSYAVPDSIYRRGGNHHKPLPKRNYGIV